MHGTKGERKGTALEILFHRMNDSVHCIIPFLPAVYNLYQSVKLLFILHPWPILNSDKNFNWGKYLPKAKNKYADIHTDRKKKLMGNVICKLRLTAHVQRWQLPRKCTVVSQLYSLHRPTSLRHYAGIPKEALTC